MKFRWIVDIDIPYVAAAVEAERRLKRGERQLYCGMCGLWRWPEECAHPNRLTARQFDSMRARVARQTRAQYPSQEDRYRSANRRRN